MKKKPFHFTKMHGLGNDFVVMNGMDEKILLNPTEITTLSHRYLGIGFDQLLLIERSQKTDFFCRIFNADGSEAEQCGNGLRCVARFVHENGLTQAKHFQIETKAGVYPVQIDDYDHIQVTMGAPELLKTSVELILNPEDNKVTLSALSMGNPHAVIKVDSLDSSMIESLAHQVANHSFFPQGVNVGFMQMISPNHIRLRTFERGVGETFACGSNACAAAVAGIANGWLSDTVQVDFRYGYLRIEWAGAHHPVNMIGPAVKVYDGCATL